MVCTPTPIADPFWEGVTLRLCRRPAVDRLAEAAPERWLTEGELRELRLLRAWERRAAWLAGRWCVKTLLDPLRGARGRLADWDVRSRTDAGRPAPPTARRRPGGRRLPVSLSHSGRLVAAAFIQRPGLSIGVDVVEASWLGRCFTETWFSRAEIARINRAGCAAIEGWAVKEAVYKSLRTTAPFRPRLIEVLHARGGAVEARWLGGGLDATVRARLLRCGESIVAVAVAAARGRIVAQAPEANRAGARADCGPVRRGPTANDHLLSTPTGRLSADR